MRVLLEDRWESGFLDYCRAPGDCRVEVRSWLVLERLDDLYFIRPRSLRLVLNYARDVGPATAARKIASRHAERLRNRKFLSCGYGRVLEGPRAGEAVVFVAPEHPACAERLALPADLVAPAGMGLAEEPEHLLHLPLGAAGPLSGPLAALRAWSPHSGAALPVEAAAALEDAREALVGAAWSRARRLPRSAPEPVRERLPGPDRAGTRPTAVVIGLGNYAKTTVLPLVSPGLEVTCAHEIDPLQIPRREGSRTWDTAPAVREDVPYAAHLIAGYHGGHADLAVQALERGAAAVIEKPIATGAAQLDRLLAAMTPGSRVFVCFQRRYTPFNAFVRRDLGIELGDAVDYHCTIFEETLPADHWYRWPSSGSRLLSNGCHWTDHFLWLNEHSPPVNHEVTAAASGTVSCSVELENGAFFTMTLTERGSRRVGMREHCEVRAGGVTVTIVDGRSYRAEDDRRVLRRARCHKHEPYRRMYRDIAGRIASGAPGDSRTSLETSARLVLDLEAQLRSRAT